MSDELAPEQPRLAADIGRALAERGLTAEEIAEIVGFAATATDNPFSEPGRCLHIVPSSWPERLLPAGESCHLAPVPPPGLTSRRGLPLTL